MPNIQGDTLKKYLEENTISILEFSKTIGISRQTLYKYFEKDSLDDEFIDKLKLAGIDIVNYTSTQYNKTVPFYDINFMAGTTEIFSDRREKPDYFIDMKPFNNCDLALPIFGDSMYPIYQNGDIVLCKEIKDKSIIPLGEAYLIVTSEHRMLKYLRKGQTPDTLLAVSENSQLYDPFPIKIDCIISIYIVKGIVKRKII